MMGSFSKAMSDFAVEFANWDGLRTVFLTFDHDWAPDYMLDHCANLLRKYDAKATFLATGPSPTLQAIARGDEHEVSLHPNNAPNSTQGSNLNEIIAGLRKTYPEAAGTRFHVLGHSYLDLILLSEYGMAYDVSTLRFNSPFLLPVWHADIRMTLLSYSWEDGFAVEGKMPSTLESIDLETPGLKILNFHPFNVYMNFADTNEKSRFQKDNPDLGNCPVEIAEKYRTGGNGAGMVLENLLESLHKRNVKTATLRELSNAYCCVEQEKIFPHE
jgi:hypothetical protein